MNFTRAVAPLKPLGQPFCLLQVGTDSILKMNGLNLSFIFGNVVNSHTSVDSFSMTVFENIFLPFQMS